MPSFPSIDLNLATSSVSRLLFLLFSFSFLPLSLLSVWSLFLRLTWDFPSLLNEISSLYPSFELRSTCALAKSVSRWTRMKDFFSQSLSLFLPLYIDLSLRTFPLPLSFASLALSQSRIQLVLKLKRLRPHSCFCFWGVSRADLTAYELRETSLTTKAEG